MAGIIETDFGYCDWDLYEEEQYDTEGNELDSIEYIKIDNLEIKEEFRGLGHGRVLLQKALDIIKVQNPDMEIKIVAEPKSDDTDVSRLCEFYDSFSEIDEVVSV